MFNVARRLLKSHSLLARFCQSPNARTFLSQAYYCNEVWDHRLNSSILQKVNLDDLYYDIDQQFHKTNKVSAVDVDIFANKVSEETYIEELLDLVHKLRLSAETCNMLNSTPHALIRYLLKHNKNNELLNVLDDRLNYGVFLDYYTANLLMDLYWKKEDYVSGVRIASQLMLQEEFDHPLSASLALLHCYKFLENPLEWPQLPKNEEPEEEVKIRVKFLRNPYNDDHFDLKDPFKIVGKTLTMITKNSSDIIDKSFYVVGLILYDKSDKAREILSQSTEKLCKEIVDMLPEDKKENIISTTQSTNVQNILEERVKQAERETAEKDVANQCEQLSKWEHERHECLEKQNEKLLNIKRLAEVEKLQQELNAKEQKLWFFENEEQIELGIQEKKVYYPKKWFGKKKKPRKIDVDYVPPEVNK